MTAYQFPEERARRIAEYERLVGQLTVDVDRLWKRAIETSFGNNETRSGQVSLGKIGFAESTTDNTWESIKTWYPEAEFVDDLKNDIARISECSLVFVGCYSVCGYTIKPFGVQNLPAVEEWIRAGGRLFIGSEHNSTYSSYERPSGGCALDVGYCNDWLTSIGSTLKNNGWIQQGRHFSDPSYPGNPLDTVRGTAAVAAYGIPAPTRAHGIISGGHSVRITVDTYNKQYPNSPQPDPSAFPPPFGVCAIEAIGDGHVILCGDSNWFSVAQPPHDTAESERDLFRAFWSLPPELLI